MEHLKTVYPDKVDWSSVVDSCRADSPFSDLIIDYLNQLSGAMLRDPRSRAYPDVVSFAFFCRRANIEALRQQYAAGRGLRLGRGIVFHIAPSNVPVNFAYTLVAGLVCGNTNIVRIPSKPFPQVDIIAGHISALSEHPVGKRIYLVQYDRNSEATAYFSSICNSRVIWGGDTTIDTIRRNPLPPRSSDVLFADRYSIAAIQADKMAAIETAELSKLAEAFYNDTYLFDQNACSAPHLVVWQGTKENVAQSQNRFWEALQNVVEQKYAFQPIMGVDKLTAFYKHAIAHDITKAPAINNKLIRVQLNKLPADIEAYRCACGYFSEYHAERLDELSSIITTKYQTLAYYGYTVEELEDFVTRTQLRGIDRIVPFGQTTAFSLTWDGYNLYEYLTRNISILS